jgi:phycocyanobilin:ferredoxin oxidoreductase
MRAAPLNAGAPVRGAQCAPRAPPAPAAARRRRRPAAAAAAAAAAPDADEAAAARAAADDPVLHDLLHGAGSSGRSGARPAGAPDPASAADAAELLRLGTWRLRGAAAPPVEALAAALEGGWRLAAGDDLALCALPRRWRYWDSLDPGGGRPLAHQLPSPAKGAPGFPRLQLENRAYSTTPFRKMHLEVAARGDGLSVLHAVVYPRLIPAYDLPILSIDLVAVGGRVTLAVADPCPVSADLSLPSFYAAGVAELQARHGVATNRRVPEWGGEIFSQLCVCASPEAPADVAAFLKYAIALSAFHCNIGRLAAPVGAVGGSGSGPGSAAARRAAGVAAGHARYAAAQLRNDKTRRVLEAALGPEATEEYMATVMFDVEEVAAEEEVEESAAAA